jgi:hypothetical protein
MGAVRPLVGLALAVVLALSVYVLGHHLARHRVPSNSSAPLEGFSGWLLVIATGQWLAVLLLLIAFVRHLPWTIDASGPMQLHLFGHLLLLVFVAWAAILMTRKSRLYPRLLRLELVLLVVLPPADALWVVEENGVYVTEPKLWIAFAVRLAATSMFAAAWYLYSQHSLRMRSTFVR